MSEEMKVYRPIYKRWWFFVLMAILFAYFCLVGYRIWAIGEEEKTAATVAQIHSQRLTMDDVDGSHLPPPPDKIIADATVQGVDANLNGIRDDVELAIFDKYPGKENIKIRAAELQYAMELQRELTSVFNSETLVAVMQEEGRGNLCISATGPKVSLSDSDDVINKAFAVTDAREKEVTSMMFNTNTRKDLQQEIYKKYMTSYGSLSGEACDLKP